MLDRVREHFSDSIQTKITAADTLPNVLVKAAQTIAETLLKGGKIYVCGNGSLASEAQKFSAHMLNKFEVERPSLPAIALSTDTSTLTAIMDDYDRSQIFSKQLEALIQPDDLLLVLSLDGHSESLIKAVDTTHNRGGKVIALTGKSGGKIAKILVSKDIEIRAPSDHHARIQECHSFILNCFCDLVDYQIFVSPAEFTS